MVKNSIVDIQIDILKKVLSNPNQTVTGLKWPTYGSNIPACQNRGWYKSTDFRTKKPKFSLYVILFDFGPTFCLISQTILDQNWNFKQIWNANFMCRKGWWIQYSMYIHAITVGRCVGSGGGWKNSKFSKIFYSVFIYDFEWKNNVTAFDNTEMSEKAQKTNKNPQKFR